MALRMVALVPDEVGQQDIDLVRALYDREQVDKSPAVVPLSDPVASPMATGDIVEVLGVVAGVFPPFMLELGAAEVVRGEDEYLLQLVAGAGSEAGQAFSAAVYREIWPESRPQTDEDIARSPLERIAMTIGRFRHERDAEQAAEALGAKNYFLVISMAGILEFDEDESVWNLLRSVPIGGAVEGGGGLLRP